MKVLFVTTHLNAGGITSYTLSLANALIKRGWRPILASGGGQFENTGDLTHFNIGIRTKCEIGPKVVRGALRLRRLIQDQQIDLVHAQTRVAAVTTSLATRGTQVPFLTTAHGFFRPHYGRRLFPCWGSAVIAISSQVLEHLKRDFRVDPSKIHLVHNGTDLTRFEVDIAPGERARRIAELGFDGRSPLIGIVARLSPVKGHHFLLQALSELRHELRVQCLVVGDGPTRDSFLKETQALGLNGSVRWIRWIQDSADILPLLDIFVLPSLQEGLSLSILEAQAAGVPVVASNVGGISEVVMDGKTGILVPPQDPQALKQALKHLFEHPALARQMGRAGSEHVREAFSLDRMADQVVQVYDTVLGRGAAVAGASA